MSLLVKATKAGMASMPSGVGTTAGPSASGKCSSTAAELSATAAGGSSGADGASAADGAGAGSATAAGSAAGGDGAEAEPSRCRTSHASAPAKSAAPRR